MSSCGAPAEQRQVVPHSGRQIARVAQLLHARGAVSLGELLAVGAVQQRQVRIARRRDPQGLHHQQLLRGVGEMVVAADHVGDPHVRVVDGDREVVENGAITPGDDELVLSVIREAHLAADLVGDDRVAAVGDVQADGCIRTVRGFAAIAAVAVLPLPGGHVIAGRRVAIGRSRLEQPFERLAVALGALVLAHRPLVPVELEPAQRVEDLLDVLGGRALAVGVLDPQDHLSPAPAGEEPVVQCRPRSPDVQGARRRRGEANADRWI